MQPASTDDAQPQRAQITIEPLDHKSAAPSAAADLDALAELLVCAVHSGAAVSFLAPLTNADARAWWETTLASMHPRGLVLVARDERDPHRSIVGTAQLHPAWAPNQPHRAEVCKVLVHPGQQRRGIARALMLAIEDAAAKPPHNFTLLTLDAKAGGPADRLYRSLGWTYIGGIPNFALDPNGKALHDDALFYKHLSPARSPFVTPSLRHSVTSPSSRPRLHHIAIICSDYAKSKDFYTRVLGLTIIRENFRAERQSYKLDLALADGTQFELFSFPDPPERPTRPEARGLRHLALAVHDLDAHLARLRTLGVEHEPIRVDEYTGARFTFIADPDVLPIELYEVTSP